MSKAFSIRVQQSGAEFPCAADDTVLRAGLRAGLGLSYECNVGSCGTCKFRWWKARCATCGKRRRV